MRSQNGTALISVMIAVGVLGILAMFMAQSMNNLMQAQRIAKIMGQKQDLRNTFRGSLSCATDCQKVVKDIPPQIGDWALVGECEANIPVIKVRSSKTPWNTWSNLFEKGGEQAVCAKNIVPITDKSHAGKQGERQYCPPGQQVVGIDFTNEAIRCQ